jgi:hypothetical protein
MRLRLEGTEQAPRSREKRAETLRVAADYIGTQFFFQAI